MIYLRNKSTTNKLGEDMVEAMCDLVEVKKVKNKDFFAEERKLLSKSFRLYMLKNVLLLENLNSLFCKNSSSFEAKEQLMEEYLKRTKSTFRSYLKALESTSSIEMESESVLDISCMKADAYRYLSMIACHADREKLLRKSHEIYRKALEESEDMVSFHPSRCKVAMNILVTLVECLNEQKEALDFGTEFLELGSATMEQLPPEVLHCSKVKLRKLKSSLKLLESQHGVYNTSCNFESDSE